VVGFKLVFIFDQILSAFLLLFRFQSASLVGQQGTVKYVAVLKKTAISLHYLSNGHQRWIENLPERYIAMSFYFMSSVKAISFQSMFKNIILLL